MTADLKQSEKSTRKLFSAKAKRTRAHKWYEYDWTHEGASACIGCDLLLDENKDDFNAVAVIVTCTSRFDLMRESEHKRFELVRNKLLKSTGMQYAGFIETSRELIYWFYASSRDVADTVDRVLSKFKKLSIRCDYEVDETHKLYYKMLYPTVAKVQTEENRKTLEKYLACGDNLAMPRRVNMHMFFPSETLLLLFVEQARLSGYATGETEFNAEYELPHGVCVHKILPLLKEDIDEATTLVIGIADKHDGVLMYWDCTTIPKRKVRM